MSIQIPNLHTSNKSAVESSAEVFILRRKDANHAGVFTVKGSLKFDPAADDYPSGAMTIKVDLSDSAKGTFVIKSVEQLDTTGKHTPTAYATGRCAADTDAKAGGCRYWLMTLNNESDELNRHRIALFGLEDIFDAYLSSCWLGLRKPSHKFYVRALQIAQADPRRSLFIDDREHNITAARAMGLHTIHYQSAALLRDELAAMNIKLKSTED